MARKNDYLNRTAQKDDVLNLINTAISENKNLSFAISGKWGTGKSFFIDMIIPELEEKCFVFKYDSWNNDYYGEPLIGMLDSIKDKLNEINKQDDLLDSIKRKLIKNIIGVIGVTIDVILGDKIGFKPFILTKKLKKFFDDCKKESGINIDFNPCDKIKTAKQVIISSMNKLSTIRPIIFAVDELDRCFPTYSLKIIERIHHISENVNHCISIFAVDMSQLQNIIEMAYTTNKDKKELVQGYLRKVIDFTYELGVGELNEDYVDTLIEYKNKFSKPSYGVYNNNIDEFIFYLLKNNSIRTTNKIVKNAMFVHELVFGQQEQPIDLMCAELMYAWAINKFGDNALKEMGKEIKASSSKIEFINYIKDDSRNRYKLLYYNSQNEVMYVQIQNMNSLMVYFILKSEGYYPSIINNLVPIPQYFDKLFNDYYRCLINIKC